MYTYSLLHFLMSAKYDETFSQHLASVEMPQTSNTDTESTSHLKKKKCISEREKKTLTSIKYNHKRNWEVSKNHCGNKEM